MKSPASQHSRRLCSNTLIASKRGHSISPNYITSSSGLSISVAEKSIPGVNQESSQSKKMGENEGEGSSSKRRKISRSENDAQLFQDLLAKANQYAEELEKFAEQVMNAATAESDIAGPIKIKNEQLMDQFSEWIKEIAKPQSRDATEGSDLATIQMLIESLNDYLQDCKSTDEEPEWIECVLDSLLSRLKDFLNG